MPRMRFCIAVTLLLAAVPAVAGIEPSPYSGQGVITNPSERAGIAPSPFSPQGITLTPTLRGKLQAVLDTIKNIQGEVGGARAKLNGAKEGADLMTVTYGCKSLPAIGLLMQKLSEAVRGAAFDPLAAGLADAFRRFDDLKPPMKANQRGVSLQRLDTFEQSLKGMEGTIAAALAPGR